jgi:outer membrane protein assembly factor BamE (lipoprotein component of BamABCDE complex)
MFFNFKYHFSIFLIFLLSILLSCQLQEPTKNHGIVFLKNRSNELIIEKHNKNDVVKLMGEPHSKSFDDEDNWLYIERVLTKGKYHKLGKHVLKSNNVLELSFNKYGVLKSKKLYDKNNINTVKFSKKKTENELTKKSFVETFLSSVKSKMYGKK